MPHRPLASCIFLLIYYSWEYIFSQQSISAAAPAYAGAKICGKARIIRQICRRDWRWRLGTSSNLNPDEFRYRSTHHHGLSQFCGVFPDIDKCPGLYFVNGNRHMAHHRRSGVWRTVRRTIGSGAMQGTSCTDVTGPGGNVNHHYHKSLQSLPGDRHLMGNSTEKGLKE